jgi:hypothetical protein
MQPSQPAVTPLATELILDTHIPAALFLSYARLYAASWQHAYRCTDPLDFESQLLPLLGLRRAQARNHLRLLRFARLLDWSSENNRYVITFPRTSSSDQAGESGLPDSVVGGGFNLINPSCHLTKELGKVHVFLGKVVGDQTTTEPEKTHGQPNCSSFLHL